MARSVALVIGFRLLALALTFGANVITARLLGPELRGELAVMVAVPSLVAAMCLIGGDTANLYFAGRSAELHDTVVRFAVVQASTIAAIIALPLALIGLAWPPARIGLSTDAFILSVGLTPVLSLVLLLGAAESGRRRAARVALLTTVGAGVWILGTAMAAMTATRSVTLVFGLFAASQVVLALALAVLSWPSSWRRRAVKPLVYLKYAAGTNLSAIALLVVLRLDIPLIQLLVGARQVGLYSVALPVAESLLLLSTAISIVLLPAVATGGADHARTIRITQVATYVAVAAALVLGLGAPAIVPLMFGSEYAGSVPVLWALLPGAVMFTAGRTLHTYLVATHSLRAATLGALVALAVSVLLAVALIPQFGAVGAAIASTVAYTSFAVVNARSAARIGGGPWHRAFHMPTIHNLRIALAGLRRPT